MKRAIMTGATTGLGYEIAQGLLGLGYELVCLSRSQPSFPCHHIPVDLTNTESVLQGARAIMASYATFDLLVLAAGGGEIQPWGSMQQADLEATIALDLTSQITLLNALLDTVILNQADIVDIGATIGFKANEHMPAYSIAKRGMRGVVENIRHILKPTPCRVIAIHPGGMDTYSNIGPNGRETIIAHKAGKQLATMMSTPAVAQFILAAIQLPKNIEISEAIISKK